MKKLSRGQGNRSYEEKSYRRASNEDKESTEVSSKNSGESINSDRVREIGEMLGVVWEKKKSGNILMLAILNGTGNDNYLVVKGNWKGKAGDVDFVNVYGPHAASKKGELWNKLEDMINGFKARESDEFNELIANTHLIEVPVGGRRFTRISNDGMKVIALDRKLSDHCPIVLKDVNVNFGPKPFRAFDIWLEEFDLESIVAGAWSMSVRDNRLDCILRDKFKNVKEALKKWCKTLFEGLDKKIEDYSQETMRWELEAEKRSLGDMERNAWIEARRKWIETEKEKADILKQKSRLKWDIEGDENSKYFNSVVKRRNNKNSIRGLMINGVWCEDPQRTGEISQGYNTSFFTLIPKVSDLIGLGDYRPISLIGFYYKIIAKLLAEIIKVVVGKLVGEVKNAFVKDWSKHNAKNLMCILKGFEKVLGLKINFNKSKVYGIRVSSSAVAEMTRVMKCGMGEIPLTYLGLPIRVSMRRESAWRPMVKKLKKRLTDWKAKTISFGGRLTLVKSVLGSVPLYYFSMFRVLSCVIKQLERVRAVRSIHGADGGMGGGVGARSVISEVWGDIIKVGEGLGRLGIQFSSSFHIKVSDGAGCSFWDDVWVGDHKLRDRFPRDTWTWSLADNGVFFVKVLSDLVDEKYRANGGERIPRKGQNRIKTGQKREAWRSPKKSEAVTVDRGRKIKENRKKGRKCKHMQNTIKVLKEERRKRG
nr:transposon TX1 [Tanacetum cinerariifolium]